MARRRWCIVRDWPMRSLLLSLAVATLVVGCEPSGSEPAPAAAKVDNPVKEAALTTVTLTPEAEARLGVVLAAVEKRRVPRARELGGQAVVPTGSSVIVSAPLSGALAASAELPRPGATVEEGRVLFTLSPVSSERMKLAEGQVSLATSRANAEAEVARAKVELDSAKTTLDRAEKLAASEVGSASARDDAAAQVRLAEASLVAADARRSALAGIAGDARATSQIELRAPIGGTLHRLLALPGQVVAAGAPLFEIARLDPMWIQVPVYVGDLASVDTGADALVGALSDASERARKKARPVAAPPSARSAAASADLYYAIDNSDGLLRPGQTVAISVPLRAEEEALVVPWSAVVHDIYGGAWVYESTAPHVFTRRRVQVRHVSGELAVLATGPKVGASVVREGAAELFGTELGTGK